MDIALFSGAIKNAGDYLITERAKQLLEEVYPNSKIAIFIRNHALSDEDLKIINKKDAIIFAGGPCYKTDLYPDAIPLRKDLNEIKPKMMILGAGWYGDTTTPREIWNYKFQPSSMELLNRVVSDTYYLGCRDYYSLKVLLANNLSSGIMTGCPAWYDLNLISKRLNFKPEPAIIAISDPADIAHYGQQSIQIIKYLKRRFAGSKIFYVFHRGIAKDKFTDEKTAEQIKNIILQLQELDVEYYDISYGSEGFKLYDSCDLHIGYRVHAHIYNLSHRNLSVLIEEDARGAGINEVLGLWSIKAYSRKKEIYSSLPVKAYNKFFDYTKKNEFCIKELNAYLNYIFSSNGELYNWAFARMEQTYEKMRFHIESLKKFL